MPLERLTDWRSRLSQHIEAERFRPFVWGEHDCCLWICDCIKVMTGVDIAEPYRGQYENAFGAIKQMRLIDNVKTVHSLALKRIGPTKPWQFAKTGDIVAANLPNLGVGEMDGTGCLSLGVCFGNSAYFVGPDGLFQIPIKMVEHAYG